MLLRMEGHPVIERRNPEIVNRVAELLERSNVDPNTIDRIRDLKFKSYGIAAKVKGEDGIERLQTEGLYSTTFSADPMLSAEDNPCLTQAPPITVTYTPSDAPRIMRQTYSITIISDAQIGFMRGSTGALEPIHDPLAISVMQEIVAAERPRRNVWIGDVADATQFSRWPMRKEFVGCAQASIDEVSRILAQTHAAAGPQCESDEVVGGNHDSRFQIYAESQSREFAGIKRAGSLPHEWPVASLPFLARFDEIGIRYTGEYPGGELWLFDDLVCMHAPPKKLEMRASVIHGHTHHLSVTTHAQHHRGGRSNYFIYDVGCLCHVGSRTDPQSLVITQVPSDRARTDWSQGLAVVDVIDGKAPRHQINLIRIENGVAIHRGEVFKAQSLLDYDKISHAS